MNNFKKERAERHPKISIRKRLILAFLLIFSFTVIINGWIIYTLSELERKILFLEVTDNYMNEIQQTRRFEKNYLLYGTNMEDAMEHIDNAQNILKNNRSRVINVLQGKNFNAIINHVADYETLLIEIGKTSEPLSRKKIETELRNHGSRMISIASDFEKKERVSVNKGFKLARRIPFIFLIILLAMMFAISTFLMREILNTLTRFMGYTKRIAKGDFTHIDTKKKYHDEFTQLAVAINHMVDELERRHNILVESHKIRAIGSLVAGVAHELNNPLNNIMLTASSMEEDYHELDEEEKMEMITDIIGEAERSRKIVRNLLDFARESKTRSEPLRLEDILQKSVRLVGNQVKIAKVHLNTNIPPNLPPIHSDGQLLTQVFVNIILNAVDALHEKGNVSISVDANRQEGFLCVDITDDGPGIPEHVLQRIFEPFFTTKPTGKGTGLGLSVSRGIIGKLGGHIRVKSEVSKGTTFTVMLPKTDIPFKV